MNRQAVAQELVKVAKLLVATDFPKPSNINDTAWEKWVGEEAPKVDELLRKHGVKVVKVNPADAFYSYIDVEKDGRKFQIGLNEVSHSNKLKEMEAFLKGFRKAVDAFDELKKFDGPFSSDVFRQLKSNFPGAGRSKAYQVVVDWLRAAGIKVWPD